MMILLLCLISSFQWYPLEEGEGLATVESILNSEAKSIIMSYGGKESICRMIIHLRSGIFRGGDALILPEEFKIRQTPEDLILLKRYVEIKRYNRYTAIYRGREIEDEWEELKRESERALNVRSLERVSRTHLKEYLPDMVIPMIDEEEKLELSSAPVVIEKPEIKIPEKRYFSFILVQNGYKRLLIPVMLHLSPIYERAQEIARLQVEGGTK